VSLFQSWVEKMAGYVKSLDRNHMLASGHSSMRTNLVELEIADIDFGTWHGYPAYEKIDAQAFGSLITDYCARGRSFGKPVILEEFGIAQSNTDRPKSIVNGSRTSLQTGIVRVGWYGVSFHVRTTTDFPLTNTINSTFTTMAAPFGECWNRPLTR